MSAGGLRALLWSVLVTLLIIFLITSTMAQSGAQPVPCRYVPNGSNITIACANGFWQTITPDGEVFTGQGMSDPHETMRGSGIVINPGTGGPQTGLGGGVTPPTQQPQLLAPGQAEQFGLQPRLD
jgi:hypothetical protein